MVNRYEFLRRVVREKDNEKVNAVRIECLLSGMLNGLISGFLTLHINSGICLEVVCHDQLLLILSPLVVVVVAAAAAAVLPPPPTTTTNTTLLLLLQLGVYPLVPLGA